MKNIVIDTAESKPMIYLWINFNYFNILDWPLIREKQVTEDKSKKWVLQELVYA